MGVWSASWRLSAPLPLAWPSALCDRSAPAPEDSFFVAIERSFNAWWIKRRPSLLYEA